MFIAKLNALLGGSLFAGGAIGALPGSSVAIGAALLLVAATIAAVVLEGRDLDPAAGLATRSADRGEATVAEPFAPAQPLDETSAATPAA